MRSGFNPGTLRATVFSTHTLLSDSSYPSKEVRWQMLVEVVVEKARKVVLILSSPSMSQGAHGLFPTLTTPKELGACFNSVVPGA